MNSRTCVRVENNISEWFPVQSGATSGICGVTMVVQYMGGIVRKVGARMLVW